MRFYPELIILLTAHWRKLRRKMEIGKQKISTLMPALREICQQHGLILNRAKDFKIARWILAHRVISES